MQACLGGGMCFEVKSRYAKLLMTGSEEERKGRSPSINRSVEVDTGCAYPNNKLMVRAFPTTDEAGWGVNAGLYRQARDMECSFWKNDMQLPTYRTS